RADDGGEDVKRDRGHQDDHDVDEQRDRALAPARELTPLGHTRRRRSRVTTHRRWRRPSGWWRRRRWRRRRNVRHTSTPSLVQSGRHHPRAPAERRGYETNGQNTHLI